MSKKDDKDLERPHYYSQFWINVARQGGAIEGSDDFLAAPQMMDRPGVAFAEAPARPASRPPVIEEPEPEEEIDIPLPVAPPKPIKQKVVPPRPAPLSSFADLAALGFGADTVTEELPVGADDDEEAIVSRLESEFEMGHVEPDEEEAASLETLSEEEEEFWDEEEEEAEDGLPRRPARGVPPKPSRRPPPRRREF